MPDDIELEEWEQAHLDAPPEEEPEEVTPKEGETEGEPPAPEEEKPPVEGKKEDETPQGVLTADGKNVMPWSRFEEVQERARKAEARLRDIDEAKQRETEKVTPDAEGRIPISKASEEDLWGAREMALDEGNSKLVNSIDRELRRRDREGTAQVTQALPVVLERYQAQTAFKAGNAWYGSDPLLTRMADQLLSELEDAASQGHPEWSGKSYSDAFSFISKTLLPYSQPKTQPQTEPPKVGLSAEEKKTLEEQAYSRALQEIKTQYNIKDPAFKRVPLAAVASGGANPGNTLHDQLDDLEGEALEEALMNMTDADRQKYVASKGTLPEAKRAAKR